MWLPERSGHEDPFAAAGAVVGHKQANAFAIEPDANGLSAATIDENALTFSHFPQPTRRAQPGEAGTSPQRCVTPGGRTTPRYCATDLLFSRGSGDYSIQRQTRTQGTRSVDHVGLPGTHLLS